MYDITKVNDKELEKLENRLRKMYEQASDELAQTTSDYFAKYRERFKREELAMLTTTLDKDEIADRWVQLYGSLDGFNSWYKKADHAYGETAQEAQQKFQAWEMSQLGRGEHWEMMRDQMAQRLTEVNQQAQGYTNGILPAMYSSESNAVMKIAQDSAMEQGITGIRFDLVDEHTVARLMAGSREIRPYKRIEINLPRDTQWNLGKLQNALLQGILQGDSIDKMSKRFEAVVGMNRASAIRNARTAVTCARSAGKQDRYNDLAKQGVVFTKIWVATDDERTREEHAEADGQEVDYNLPFEVGGEELMYPADEHGSPWNIYNCRCTMKTGKPQFHSILSEEQREQANIKIVDDISHNTKEMPISDDEIHDLEYNIIRTTLDDIPFDEIMERLGVEPNKLKKLDKELSEAELISKLAKADNMGACVSVAMAYVGNKAGYDVIDFRKEAVKYIKQNVINEQLLNFDIDNIHSLTDVGSLEMGVDLLGRMKENHEYYLSCGQHVSIVKIGDDGFYQYLDLQIPTQFGWNSMGKDYESELIKRFGMMPKSAMPINSKETAIMIDVEDMTKSKDFINLLRYINNQ